MVSGLYFGYDSKVSGRNSRANNWFRYIQQDRIEDAIDALSRLRDDVDIVQAEIQEMSQAIAYEKAEMSGAYAPLWKDKAIRYRFREQHHIRYPFAPSS